MDLKQAIRAAGRNLGWLMASRGVAAVLSLVYLGLATRTLGIEGFGRFALVTAATQAIAGFVGFQTWQIVVQYGVHHLAQRDDAALRRLFRFCWRLDLGSAAAGAALAGLVLGVFGARLGIDRSLAHAALVLVAAQLLSLRSTPLGILRLHDRFGAAALAEGMTPVTRLIGAIVAWATDAGLAGFVAAWALGEVLTAAAFWRLAARTRPLGLFARAEPGRVLAENPGIARFAISSNAATTLGLSTKQAPVLLVGAYVGPAAAGGFRLAYQLAQALTKLATMLARAAFPELVRAVKGITPASLAQAVGKLSLTMAVAGAIILVLVLLFGRALLGLVGGPPYVAAFPLLMWLAAAGCIDIAAVGFEPLLLALHRAGTAFLLRCGGAIVLIATMIALLPTQGTHGAAIAILAGAATTALLLATGTFRAISKESSR